MPVASEIKMVNVSTRASSLSSTKLFATTAGRYDQRMSRPHFPNNSPIAPPPSPRRKLSVSNWRISCERPAPIASRIAISRRRAEARARSRLATFEHAMSRTSPTIVSNTAPPRSSGRRIPGNTTASASGATEILRPLFESGYCCSSARAALLKFASACAAVTPGLSRPAVLKTVEPRSCSQSPDWRDTTAGAIIDGSHISGPNIDVTPLNPLGATPTMVKSRRLSVIVRPTTSELPPNRRCHKL